MQIKYLQHILGTCNSYYNVATVCQLMSCDSWFYRFFLNLALLTLARNPNQVKWSSTYLDIINMYVIQLVKTLFCQNFTTGINPICYNIDIIHPTLMITTVKHPLTNSIVVFNSAEKKRTKTHWTSFRCLFRGWRKRTPSSLPVTSTYQAGIGRTAMSKLAVNTRVSMKSAATSSTTQD